VGDFAAAFFVVLGLGDFGFLVGDLAVFLAFEGDLALAALLGEGGGAALLVLVAFLAGDGDFFGDGDFSTAAFLGLPLGLSDLLVSGLAVLFVAAVASLNEPDAPLPLV